jgi:transposase
MQHLGTVPAHTRIVIEATSSYWVALAVVLHEAGYQVSTDCTMGSSSSWI